MVALILSTLLSFFLFITFGIFITKALKITSILVEKLLIGLVVCNTLTTCISLFFPINIFIVLTFTVLGLILLIFIKKEIKTYVLAIYKNSYIIFYSFFFILIAFLLSLRSPLNYDTGLYHIQSIKWIEQFSVVPGLANLHGRFGFNPNIFTFVALTSFEDLFKQEIFSVNFSLFSIFVFYFVKKQYLLLKQQKASNLIFIFFFLFFIILSLPNLSSPSPDFSSTAIALFIFARMIDLSGQKKNVELKKYFPILILSIYALTIKLAVIPILLLFVFVFIKYKSELRKSIWFLPFLCLIIIPWLVRNIITTGWLVYPFPSLDLFSFDWKVPIESVISEKEAVTGWARSPGANYRKAANMVFIDWFPAWWQRMPFLRKGIFVSSIIFPLIVFIGQFLKKITINLFTNAIITTSFVGVIFWLLLAPDWRFGQSFILVAAMSPLLLLKPFMRQTLILEFFKRYINLGNKAKTIFGVLLFLNFGNYVFRHYSSIKSISKKALYSNVIMTPTRILSNVDFKTYNISGVDIYVPIKGDRCFDQNIPCTTYPDTTLILRKNTLKSGFKHKLISKNK